jgi:hypothetical protein
MMLEQDNRCDPIGRSPAPRRTASTSRRRSRRAAWARSPDGTQEDARLRLTDGQADELLAFANPDEAHIKTSTIA